ncbi:MAG: MATE family efflux transporter [Clostridia bacterium]|nr:MATE family efflux transporter [Clostridia bacterium]
MTDTRPTAHRPARRHDLDMTEGSILGCLVRFALPLLVGNLFQQLYNLVDTWVIGRFGAPAEYAAVGSIGPIINVLIGFFSGLASGAGVIISHRYGARDEQGVRRTVHTAMTLTLLLCVLFTAAGVLTTPLILRAMLRSTADGGVYGPAATYLFIYFGGMSGLLIYNMAAGVLRAVGDSRRPFRYLVVASVINIVLDLVFVAWLRMGVAGVAVATVVAQLFSAVLSVSALLRSPGVVRLRLRELGIDRRILGRIFYVGLPAALQLAVTAFSNVFVQGYIGAIELPGFSDATRMQVVALGAWTTYSKIDQFIFLPITSLALAVTTFVGQNLGRGKVARAKKGLLFSWLLATGVTVLLMIPVISLAPYLSGVFSRDADMIAVATTLLRCITPFYLFSCVNQTFAAGLRGAGRSIPPMVILLGSFVGFRQLYLWIVSTYVSRGLLPIAMSYPAGWFVCCTSMLVYYFAVGLGDGRKLAENPTAEAPPADTAAPDFHPAAETRTPACPTTAGSPPADNAPDTRTDPPSADTPEAAKIAEAAPSPVDAPANKRA